MQWTVVLLFLVLSLTTLNALPWSPSDPMQPALFQIFKNQKQRNLAKVQLLPQSAINFVGPRQSTSVEEDEYDGYYDEDDDDDDDDVYEDSKTPVDYAESDEADYEWR